MAKNWSSIGMNVKKFTDSIFGRIVRIKILENPKEIELARNAEQNMNVREFEVQKSHIIAAIRHLPPV